MDDQVKRVALAIVSQLERAARVQISWDDPHSQVVAVSLATAAMAAMPEPWQPITTAPRAEIVLTYGGSGLRFMSKDVGGQWRNAMGRPRNEPRCWMPLPAPPGARR